MMTRRVEVFLSPNRNRQTLETARESVENGLSRGSATPRICYVPIVPTDLTNTYTIGADLLVV